MNELQVFNNPEFGQVRSMLIDDAPWFVGRDVANALEYADTAKAIKAHVDNEDKGVGETPTPGGTQSVTIINESGLYSLIFGSKLPSAKRFKRWVTSEILPTIRKTGKYEVAKENEAVPEETVLPERILTTDDYLQAARIVATCRNERMPYVLSCLAQAGISTPFLRTKLAEKEEEEPPRDKYEVMRLLVKASAVYGYSDAQIGRMTGFNRAQIRMYRSGQRFPKADRAEYIKTMVAPLVTGGEDE